MSYIVDILLLTYNNLSNTKKCIDNIYKHTNLNDFKLFILDNNSTDKTIEYLKEIEKQYNNVYVDFQKENYGIIRGRNKCFDFSRDRSNGQYIIFLDNDQEVQLGWLDSYVEMMKDYDIVGVEAWRMKKDFYPYKKVRDKEDNFSYVGGGGLMLEAWLFEELGKFDEDYDFIYFEDPSFCFLAYYQEYKIGWNYNSVINHHHKGALLSSKNRKYFMDNWEKFQQKWKNYEIPVFKML